MNDADEAAAQPVTPSSSPRLAEQRFQGVGVSPGLAHGPVFLLRRDDESVPDYPIRAEDVPSEVARFEAALVTTRVQILEMQSKIADAIGAKDAGIFDAHLLVVEDRAIIDEVQRKLAHELRNVESIYRDVANRYADTLSRIDDPYLRERALDIQDVTRRVLMNLVGRGHIGPRGLDYPHILVAHNVTPSDTAQLNRQLVLGFATEIGSSTAHSAIMARSLNIPALVGLHDALTLLQTGDQVLLDGYHGLLVVNPSEQTLREYEELARHKARLEAGLVELRETASNTRDGRHIVLSANIELPDDVPAVKASGAEGIGLYRTEFFYLNKSELPSEEEQYENYRRVASDVLPHPVIIRTLDLGGDKFMSSLHLPAELNPFLGWRAIRFCLERIDIFKVQLRAILRASALGNVKMMYPLISGLGEVRSANALLEECKAELRAEGREFDDNMEVGVMIEVPSAAICAPHIAREVAFFSIGTNDLIQYTVAVDRVNERIAHLYEPTHPAIIRLIKMVVDASHAAGIWTGVCGEMAGDIALTPLLLGLGIDELSAGASLVPRVKRAVQSVELSVCQSLAERVLEMDAPDAILAECESTAREFYPDLLG
ncbi:MAG: phosphoenolpyruvate--protein phosphotransferase [Verrucomicrobia bacterium]|nr:phosphoenolpyruvate--protein phosphotransferase [Verrucomicrobiota bacterium]